AQAAISSTLPLIKGQSPLAPFSLGDTFKVPFVYGQYEVRFQQTLTGSEAWQAFSSYSSSYKPPPAGWQIVLGKASIRNTSGQDAAPFLEVLDPDYIGGDGTVY
ncbi:hypothetical protein JZU54_07010, partial [bacterium]|nr:hypothetical protein [bacterium]